ncbi:MAG: YqgE/AlgH family protein [Limnohabitans sp.]
MSADFASTQLSHHFLIAMPGLEDPVFAKSVVYLCEHSERGAMGLIINKPGDLSLKHLFEKVELPLTRQDLLQSNVLQGGPVQTERGFVLHEPMLEASSDEKSNSIYASTLSVPGGLAMTTSKDVLEAMANGSGPQRVLVTLGYASWGEGQLESEIGENSWLTVAADQAVIFDTPIEQRYDKALSLLGLQAWMLSSQVGHA